LSLYKQCRDSGGMSPDCHARGPLVIPDQAMSDFWWRELHWDTFFFIVLLFSPVSIMPPLLRTYLHTHVSLTKRANGRKWAPSKKQLCFGKCSTL